MPKYDWKSDSLPELKNHSKCKHDILYKYLQQYIRVLHTGTLRYGNKKFNLTIVDGCAGGGKFLHDGKIVNGSPFVIIDAIKKVKMLIRYQREKDGHPDIDLNIDVVLVEKDKKTAQFLKEELIKANHANSAQVIPGDFNEKLQVIINLIKRKSRGQQGRCLFFLDQYGYTQIGLYSVREILRSLKSEVILTFAVDYLIDYLSESKREILVAMGFPSKQIEELTQMAKNTKENRYTIEQVLAQHIQLSTGAKFYTPFFIRGDDTHRGYWLVHLSSHYRARDEMMNIHWEKGNTLQHFGMTGIDMLGYRSDNDELYTQQLPIEEFRFDHHAKEKVLASLPEELSRFVHEKREVPFSDLMSEVFNDTPANRSLIVDGLEKVVRNNEILVKNKELSSERKNLKNIKDTDIIMVSPQTVITFGKPK